VVQAIEHQIGKVGAISLVVKFDLPSFITQQLTNRTFIMTRFFYRPVTAATTASYDPFNALVRDFFAPETTSEMRVKFKEAANEYTLLAELPGVGKEDINVEINGADVKISAATKANTKADENATESADEWTKRSYARSFSLPAEIDDEKAVAQYENGVLRLTLPKKSANAAKRLMIA
jgi:HSP20 family protein